MEMEQKSEPMKKGQAKSWLGNFHWVSLPVNPDKADVTFEAKAWCKENLGTSSSRWFEKDGKFFFKEEKDVTMFILRWSDER